MHTDRDKFVAPCAQEVRSGGREAESESGWARASPKIRPGTVIAARYTMSAQWYRTIVPGLLHTSSYVESSRRVRSKV